MPWPNYPARPACNTVHLKDVCCGVCACVWKRERERERERERWVKAHSVGKRSEHCQWSHFYSITQACGAPSIVLLSAKLSLHLHEGCFLPTQKQDWAVRDMRCNCTGTGIDLRVRVGQQRGLKMHGKFMSLLWGFMGKLLATLTRTHTNAGTWAGHGAATYFGTMHVGLVGKY